MEVLVQENETFITDMADNNGDTDDASPKTQPTNQTSQFRSCACKFRA